MTTLLLEVDPAAVAVETDETMLRVHLADGRVLAAPLAWYPRLLHGTPAERARYEISGDGYGLHWPDLDEDLHVEGLLAGKRSAESEASLKRWLNARP